MFTLVFTFEQTHKCHRNTNLYTYSLEKGDDNNLIRKHSITWTYGFQNTIIKMKIPGILLTFLHQN